MKSRHSAMGWRLFRIGGRSSALILIVLCVRNSLMNPLSPRVGRLHAGDEDEIAARPGAKGQFHCNERFSACDGGMQMHYCRFCIYVPLFSPTRHMMSTQNRGLLMRNVEYGGRGEGRNCISRPFAVVSHMLRRYSVAALRFGNINRRDSASLQGWCFRLETRLREGRGMQLHSPPLCIFVPPISRESSAHRPDYKTVSIIAQKSIRDPAHVVGRRRETAGFSIG